MECSICLESLLEGSHYSQDFSMTQCGHIFHEKCLVKWLGTAPSCPNCRHRIFTCQLRRLSSGSDYDPKVHKNLREVVNVNQKKRAHSISDVWDFIRFMIWCLGWAVWILGFMIIEIGCMVWGLGWVIRKICYAIAWLGGRLTDAREKVDWLEDFGDWLGVRLDCLKDKLINIGDSLGKLCVRLIYSRDNWWN